MLILSLGFGLSLRDLALAKESKQMYCGTAKFIFKQTFELLVRTVLTFNNWIVLGYSFLRIMLSVRPMRDVIKLCSLCSL